MKTKKDKKIKVDVDKESTPRLCKCGIPLDKEEEFCPRCY